MSHERLANVDCYPKTPEYEIETAEPSTATVDNSGASSWPGHSRSPELTTDN
jgi:hypothetical protein